MSNLPGMLAGGEGFRASGSAGRVSGEPWRAREREREDWWGFFVSPREWRAIFPSFPLSGE